MSLLLDKLPTAEEFYRDFWNKKPFAVRGMIPTDVIETLIDEDHLAGLSLEEDVKSRLVKKGKTQSAWTCNYGPFREKDFAKLGEEDWSLLVQNIDQYHEETAELLKFFTFSPRWLLDDIMASFSPKGGTVGAHLDSYHVFLVQGKGERRWKIAHEAHKDEDYIEDIPLKILKAPFDGEEITVTQGDVIYIPPRFAHQGVSLKPSLTYSVGFLGPTLSEMLSEFGQYIEEHHPAPPRYLGKRLTKTAGAFRVMPDHMDDFRCFMTEIFDQDYFSQWLAHYFSRSLDREDDGSDDLDIEPDIDEENLMLVKPPAVKMMVTPLKAPQTYYVAVGDFSFELAFNDLFIMDAMAREVPFSAEIFARHRDLLQDLLDHNILITV